MTTSDGISTEDWDEVRELALECLAASFQEDPEAMVDVHRRMQACLDSLEMKYGPLPSIVATRADYLDEGDPRQEAFLRRAYHLASTSGDDINVVETAHSLVRYFVDEAPDPVQAREWLVILEQSILDDEDNPIVMRDLVRFREMLK